MPTKALPFALVAVLALGLVTTHAGGWAVITVEDLPEPFVAGRATTIDFSVRQHGQRLLGGLTGGIAAKSGSRSVEAAAAAGKEPGYYSATLTLPEPGEWTITIHSGFVTSTVTLLPMKAVSAAEAAAALPIVRRGEQLFVAKGCNSCHQHGRIARQPIAPVGADLTDKRYSDILLSKILEDPSILPASGTFGMPNLNLQPKEIAALVAFINKPTTRP